MRARYGAVAKPVGSEADDRALASSGTAVANLCAPKKNLFTLNKKFDKINNILL